MRLIKKRLGLLRRKARVRLRVTGTSSRPRLCVYRSNSHIYAQIVDDTLGRTLVSASSCNGSLQSRVGSGGTISAAKEVGVLLAERAKALQINAVVFDRGGRLYHGRVKALAEASKSGGLVF
jgi:large subunit ribosomal protein L18